MIKSIINLSIFILFFYNIKADNNDIKKISYASIVSSKDFVVKLEHPKIYLSNSSSTEDGELLLSFTFESLCVIRHGKNLYINNKLYPCEKVPTTIYVSDNLNDVTIDGNKLIKSQNIDCKNCDIYDPSAGDIMELEDGIKIKFEGGFLIGGSGVSFDAQHFIVDRSGLIVKLWGDDLYVWGRHIGKTSQLANKDKVIILNTAEMINKLGEK